MNALVLISDGRYEYLGRCIESLGEHLDLDWFDACYLIDDSGEPMMTGCAGFQTIAHGTRKGLAASVRTAWAAAGSAEFVFHLEEDFTFNEDVDLDGMAKILDSDSTLAQMSLKRQPWSPPELDAGGFIECDPGAYTDVADLSTGRCDYWLEHSKLFTLNPCLIPQWAIAKAKGGTEQEITDALLEDPDVRFGIWGKRFDNHRVNHIGLERSPQWSA